jgi:hypothetical protein
MNQQAEAKVYFVEPGPTPEPSVRDQIESTAQAIGAADEAFLREAIDGVVWERRGFLRRLSRRPGSR